MKLGHLLGDGKKEGKKMSKEWKSTYGGKKKKKREVRLELGQETQINNKKGQSGHAVNLVGGNAWQALGERDRGGHAPRKSIKRLFTSKGGPSWRKSAPLRNQGAKTTLGQA